MGKFCVWSLGMYIYLPVFYPFRSIIAALLMYSVHIRPCFVCLSKSKNEWMDGWMNRETAKLILWKWLFTSCFSQIKSKILRFWFCHRTQNFFDSNDFRMLKQFTQRFKWRTKHYAAFFFHDASNRHISCSCQQANIPQPKICLLITA